MRQFLTSILMLAMVAIGVASCDKSSDEYMNTKDVAILYVADASPITRVAFEDQGSEGIEVTWEVGDTFTLYDEDGYRLDDFQCISVTDGNKFESTLAETTLESLSFYSAIYPASDKMTLDEAKDAIDPSVQDGGLISSLKNSCYMLCDFQYISDDVIIFDYQTSIVALTFEKSVDYDIDKLVFSNGEDLYFVDYSEIPLLDDTEYTAYIMINSQEAEERDIYFLVYAQGETEPREVRKLVIDYAYTAGKCYSVSISSSSVLSAEDLLFSGGLGLETYPYKISTYDDLKDLSDDVAGEITYSGKYFIMTTDIDMGDVENNFTPIGVYDDYFSFEGSFDGCGYTVSGLNLNLPDQKGVALFGYIDNATIKNITVNGTFNGNSEIGGVVGLAFNSEISNCYSNATITGDKSMGAYNLGGIVGYLSDSSISSCYSTTNISGNKDLGGIVGNLHSSTITDCSNSGSIYSYGYYYTGGIVGYSISSDVTNCYNSGDVIVEHNEEEEGGIGGVGGIVGYSWYESSISNCTNTGYVKGKKYVGGITGMTKNSSHISGCVNKGSVLAEERYGGGIAGYSYSSKISYSSNSGAIKQVPFEGDITTYNGLGGIVGYTESSILNCYNTGSVTSEEDDRVGGIAGGAEDSIINCYNTAAVTGAIKVGGIAGMHLDVVINCYNTGSIKGSSKVGGISGDANNNNAEVYNCYNNASVIAGDYAFINVSSIGAIVGESSSSVKNCYWNRAAYIWLNEAVGIDFNTTNVASKTTAEMKLESFVDLLNEGAEDYVGSTVCGWKWVQNSTPTLDFDVVL